VAGTTGTADVNSTELLTQLNRHHTARPVRATNQASIPPSRLRAGFVWRLFVKGVSLASLIVHDVHQTGDKRKLAVGILEGA